MNCFECAVQGETVTAVAICHHCGAGMCLEHVHAAQAFRAGGVTLMTGGCAHDLTALPATRAAAVGVARQSGRVRGLGRRSDRRVRAGRGV
jgi:hypothetical protein